MAIKNIVFDLGNVLLPIAPQATADMLEELMGMPYANLIEQPDDMLAKFETGRINYIVFFNYLSRISNHIVHINELIPAWNKMLQPLPLQVIFDLEEIASRYNCYLLSNTNEIHLQWFDKHLTSNQLYDLWYNHLFKKCYYSHLIKLRKPDHETYYWVMSDASIHASETLYLDDLSVNVEAAAFCGLNARQYLIGSRNMLSTINEAVEHIK